MLLLGISQFQMETIVKITAFTFFCNIKMCYPICYQLVRNLFFRNRNKNEIRNCWRKKASYLVGPYYCVLRNDKSNTTISFIGSYMKLLTSINCIIDHCGENWNETGMAKLSEKVLSFRFDEKKGVKKFCEM